MYHYLFTNDLRIDNLKETIPNVVYWSGLPNEQLQKSQQNVKNTYAFYFNIIPGSNCIEYARKNKYEDIFSNFIKKFQFPNVRTETSFKDSINDGICLAPFRTILKVLYTLNIISPEEGKLSEYEIEKFIFFNSEVAKRKSFDCFTLANKIIKYRRDRALPETIEQNSDEIHWLHQDRQIKCFSGILSILNCVKKEDNGTIKFDSENLSDQDKSRLFDAITYNSFWEPNEADDYNTLKRKYQEYMDMAPLEPQEKPIGMNLVGTKYPRNRIIFGAPGTGKSYKLKKDLQDLLGDDYVSNFERVTFHPDYTYGNFVGVYKPSIVEGKLSSSSCDENVVSILLNENKTDQEKNEELSEFYTTEDGNSLSFFPLLTSLYSKNYQVDQNQVNGFDFYNCAETIRPYINLLTEDSLQDSITYRYVPGPFMRTLVNALKDSHTNYVLIIEEINRANMAAVFGDVFQLLDRDDEGNSEYPIQTSEDMRKYLSKELGGNPNLYSTIRLPSNMYIWATMNSADQGVFPMDTAFKRRWNFEYIGIDDKEDELNGAIAKFPHFDDAERPEEIEWNIIRKSINRFLSDNKINEDKFLGPFFITSTVLNETKNNLKNVEIQSTFLNVFKSKVLMYLFEDAAKLKRDSLFNSKIDRPLTYSGVCKYFDQNGVGVFNDEIIKNIKIPFDAEANGEEN